MLKKTIQVYLIISVLIFHSKEANHIIGHTATEIILITFISLLKDKYEDKFGFCFFCFFYSINSIISLELID